MDLVQKPSKNLFVVHAKHDRRKIQEALRKFGEVEELEGSNNLLLVHLPKEAAEKKIWRSIQKKLGEGEVVHPVLVDESGHHQYPTGEINVRFQRTSSDTELEQFAAAHRLRLRSRNEFIPQQAMFEPIDAAERYVPDLVQEISQDKRVQVAWANTLSRYDRI